MTKPKIKDAAVSKQGIFTVVELDGKHYIHYNLADGYVLFEVKQDDELARKINNFLADVLEREHKKATRDALVAFAQTFAN